MTVKSRAYKMDVKDAMVAMVSLRCIIYRAALFEHKQNP